MGEAQGSEAGLVRSDGGRRSREIVVEGRDAHAFVDCAPLILLAASLAGLTPYRHTGLQDCPRLFLRFGIRRSQAVISMISRPVILIVAIYVMHGILCLISRRVDKCKRLAHDLLGLNKV